MPTSLANGRPPPMTRRTTLADTARWSACGHRPPARTDCSPSPRRALQPGAILNGMDAGAVYELPVHPRHLALDERGVGLRATWHPDHGFVNVSLWSGDRCVQTFHLTAVEAGRLIGFLAGVLADAVPEPVRPSAIAAVDPSRHVEQAGGRTA